MLPTVLGFGFQCILQHDCFRAVLQGLKLSDRSGRETRGGDTIRRYFGCLLVGMNAKPLPRYLIKFLEGAVDVIGAAGSATGIGTRRHCNCIGAEIVDGCA